MSYNQTIKDEAQYIDDLGPSANEDNLSGIYRGILSHWFPLSRGYILDHREGKIMIRHGGFRNPLIMLGLKRPSNWTLARKDMVWEDLQTYIEGQFEFTEYNTIYGIEGIGLHWMVFRMERSGGQPTLVLDWQDNVASDTSYTHFQTIADLVYNIQ